MSKQEYQKDKLYKSCVLLSEVCNDLITSPELRTKVETILEEIRAKYEEYP